MVIWGNIKNIFAITLLIAILAGCSNRPPTVNTQPASSNNQAGNNNNQSVIINTPTAVPANQSATTNTPTKVINNQPTANNPQNKLIVQGPITGCTKSAPTSAAYSVTLCFTSPANNSTLTGDSPVDATATVSGTNPGIQRMVFYINGDYLLTDYQSAYSFSLPTTYWADGSYQIAVQALMRDGFSTQPAALNVNFNNGSASSPVNNKQFSPATGTLPQNGSPFVVVAVGDGASGEITSAKVADMISSLNPNLLLYLGDVYEKGSISEFYNWYGNQGTNFGTFRSITNPTIGNHEYTSGSPSGYFTYWDNIPNYYSFDAGGWHFISLNANSNKIGVDNHSSQYAWLASDLAAHTQSCTIVYYHQPLFNIGPEGDANGMSEIWSLLAQNNVTIVLNGHDHDYQRWVPLDGNGQPNPSGITEFVAGGGGHGLQTFSKTDNRVAYSNDLNPAAFGALKLSINKDGVNFDYINDTGTSLDSGTIPCAKGGSDTQAPSTPAGLSAAAAAATQVKLSWEASTDNTGVSGYTLYRDNNLLAKVSSATLTYSDHTALPNTTYSYSVDAFDAVGNHSAQSTPASANTPQMPANLTFTTDADTYVNASSPDTNNGAAAAIRLDSTPDVHAYLHFTVQGLAGTRILRAQLRIYTYNNAGAGIQSNSVADNTWDEHTMTFANAPTLGGVLSTSGPIVGGTWVTLDVTGYISGEGQYSFGITTLSTSALTLATHESGADGTQLILYFK